MCNLKLQKNQLINFIKNIRHHTSLVLPENRNMTHFSTCSMSCQGKDDLKINCAGEISQYWKKINLALTHTMHRN